MKYKLFGLGIVVLLTTLSFSTNVSACWVYDETAWGGCIEFPGKSTARYIEYTFRCCTENLQKYQLRIGKPAHFDYVGDVYVSSHHDDNGYYVNVTFVIPECQQVWELVGTHVHVNEGNDPIPVNKGGNPKIGLFEYSETPCDPWEQTYTCYIPGVTCGQSIDIAAHAVVRITID